MHSNRRVKILLGIIWLYIKVWLDFMMKGDELYVSLVVDYFRPQSNSLNQCCGSGPFFSDPDPGDPNRLDPTGSGSATPLV